MTRVKLCGMMRPEDIQAVNKIKPEYIGFVFAVSYRITCNNGNQRTLINS